MDVINRWMPSNRHRTSADSSQNVSNLLWSSRISNRNPLSVISNTTLANNILVLRASSSVEKLSGDSVLSVQAVILEDIPRPVPMHTLLGVKQIQEICNQHELTWTLCYGRTSTSYKVRFRELCNN